MITLRELLCATDLEKPARAALRYSFFVAEQFQCPLHVLHVWETNESQRPNTYVSGAERMERAVAAHALRAQLDVVVRAVPTGAQGRATTHVAEGRLAETLLGFAERQRADVLVLGNEALETSAGGPRESLAERLMHRTACPILTVPAFDLAVVPQVKRILLALSPTSTQVADWFVLLARRFDAVVQIFHRETSRPDGAALSARLRREVEDALRRAGVGVESTFAAAGPQFGEQVLSRAELGACDMIAMSASLRGEGDLGVLAEVRARSAVPVFSVRDVAPDRLFVDSGFATGTAR